MLCCLTTMMRVCVVLSHNDDVCVVVSHNDDVKVCCVVSQR